MKLDNGTDNHSKFGTIFLHSAAKNTGLERAVNRYRERLQQKRRGDRGSRSYRKMATMSRQKPGQQNHEDTADDLFIPSLTDLADHRFRSELIRMMGTEEIRLGDATWSRKLQQKMLEDYENKQISHEQNLAEAEKRRVHDLIIEGLMEDTTGAVLSNELMGKQTATRPPRDSGLRTEGRRPSKTKAARDKPLFEKAEANRKARQILDRYNNRLYLAPKTLTLEIDPVKKPDDSKEEKRREERAQFLKICQVLPTYKCSVDISTQPAEIQRLRESRRMAHYKHLPFEIARLYDEETVEGLYRMAGRIIVPRTMTAEGEEEEDEDTEDTVFNTPTAGRYKTKTPKLR